jgi:hypothetical protein
MYKIDVMLCVFYVCIHTSISITIQPFHYFITLSLLKFSIQVLRESSYCAYWMYHLHSLESLHVVVRWPEPSAVLLWKPQIFCDCEECFLLGCDSMYSGIWVLYIILTDSKHFTFVLLVTVHQTMWFCISQCGSFQNNSWSLCSQLLYL